MKIVAKSGQEWLADTLLTFEEVLGKTATAIIEQTDIIITLTAASNSNMCTSPCCDAAIEAITRGDRVYYEKATISTLGTLIYLPHTSSDRTKSIHCAKQSYEISFCAKCYCLSILYLALPTASQVLCTSSTNLFIQLLQ